MFYKISKMLIGVLLIVLAILRGIYPHYFKMPNIKLDVYSYLLVLLGVLILFFDLLKQKISLFKKIKRRVWDKTILLIVCFTIIILRMFFKELNFDNTSLYILVLVIIIILVPDIKELLLRIKKVKKGDFELELELDKLRDKLDEVEDKTEITVQTLTPDEKFFEYLKQFSDEPRLTIPIISAEIESKTRDLATSVGINKIYSHRSTMKLLVSEGIISKDILNLNDKFMRIRNIIVHGKNDENINTADIIEAANLGLRILKLLPKSASVNQNQD
ncbi:hypothetical protein [Paenibacillus sp. BJ-4]|uniref:hypothetical protein n=1 Tax=Paenibacillus sp. BJ-4 TaxID=2878097 RepID=UPI001CF03F16|nr:hypothetical protein [Paenibacillus sp. BJ-4]